MNRLLEEEEEKGGYLTMFNFQPYLDVYFFLRVQKICSSIGDI